MAVPGDEESKKRKVEEPAGDEGNAPRGGTPGKGFKGKGKYSWSKGGGPKGGCHICGGDHYARECPQNPQNAKGGKAKGKNNPYPQQRQWSNWNPGFRPVQWQDMRPGNPKGWKGKGKGINGMWQENEEGKQLIMKPTGFMTNSKCIADELSEQKSNG